MLPPRFLARDDLQSLLDELDAAGFQVIGPRFQDGAIRYAPLRRSDDLPHGVRDSQAPGRYRAALSGEGRCFAFANSAQALKPLFFAGHEILWEARCSDGALRFTQVTPHAARPLAVLGARACDLAALALHDAHFLNGPQADAAYAERRAGALLIAVNCSHPADTCFCHSTGDGPEAQRGYDLLLDELDDGFVLHAGSERGERLLARLPAKVASSARLAAAKAQRQAAVTAQTRRLPGRDLQAAFAAALEHPRWDEVAARCLACGNCTAVCPACFCHAHAEEAALDGSVSRRARVWDSCFTEGHSYLHGLVIRGDTRKRYRQWLTHKLGAWHEQFGRAGCVGCGRCITWCPAGIDMTEETAAIVGESL